MCNPPQDGVSLDHVKDYNSSIDVHYSSGIFNKAFCLISSAFGGNARDTFSIFYHANTTYWTPNETFYSAAVSSVDSADDLGLATSPVAKAFQTVGALPDLYIRGWDNDDGAEPVQSEDIWASPDVWNCVTAGCTTHENPEYKISGSNYLYVKVHNRGVVALEPNLAYLRAYWTIGATTEIWSKHWLHPSDTEHLPLNDNFLLNGNLVVGGAEITKTASFAPAPIALPAIPAGGSIVVGPIAWQPPNPANYPAAQLPEWDKDAFGNPELCFLARIVSPYDPMNNEGLPSIIGPNVANNNNIASRNTYLVDLLPGIAKPKWVVFWVRNLADQASDVMIRIRPVLRSGELSGKDIKVAVAMDENLWRRSRDGRALYEDLRVGEGRTMHTTNLKEGAALQPLRLNGGETVPLFLSFAAPGKARREANDRVDFVIEQFSKGAKQADGALIVQLRVGKKATERPDAPRPE